MKKYSKTILEIALHGVVWIFVMLFPYFFMDFDKPHPPMFDNWLEMLFVVIIFYLNYFLLIKRYLFNHKLFTFIGFNILIFIVALGLTFKLGYGTIEGPKKLDREMDFSKEFKPDRAPLDMMISRNIFPFLLSLGVAVAIRATVKSNKEESERKKLENEHLKSELSYLKYQIQPHFFFNTLNNIYSLIDTSPDYAKEVLHRLSKLMRFILYQTNDSEVLVKDEITFIANYVELMKIRTQQNVSISIEIPPTVPEVRIPPLIYISLVENAFKHGIDPVKNSVIRIWFSVANDKLLFEVANTNFPKAQKDKSGSGIGVANVKKRLEFLYSPDEYNFEQQCVGDFYITKLTIPINHG
jgi:hypothetical protein